jgi:hypothetical protein
MEEEVAALVCLQSKFPPSCEPTHGWMMCWQNRSSITVLECARLAVRPNPPPILILLIADRLFFYSVAGVFFEQSFSFLDFFFNCLLQVMMHLERFSRKSAQKMIPPSFFIYLSGSHFSLSALLSVDPVIRVSWWVWARKTLMSGARHER